MSVKKPDPDSNRTWERAVDLAYARGCDTYNDCWGECIDAARDRIVANELDEWDKAAIKAERKKRHPALDQSGVSRACGGDS